VGWLFLGIGVVAADWPVAIYNALVTLRDRCKNAFAQIDVQLTRRYDLIPNLVEMVKGYMQHERGTPARPDSPTVSSKNEYTVPTTTSTEATIAITESRNSRSITPLLRRARL